MSYSTRPGLLLDQPTSTRILAAGPSPTLSIDCDSFAGVPLLPSSKNYVCGTKTSNRTLMSSCCNGARVTEYLGCFQHCQMDDFDPSNMRDFVACVSNNGNSNTSELDPNIVDQNVFCQSQLNSTVDAAPTSGATTRGSSRSTCFLFCIVLLALLLCETATAECTVTIPSNSALIRQGTAREIGSGIRCSTDSPTCIVDQTGTNSFVSAKRTLAGVQDASNAQYDEFFSALGEATDPPRLFAANSEMQVRQWAVGVPSDQLVNDSFWAPFMYCVNVTASDCANVEEDTPTEACGAWYQGGGTGLEDDAVVQGVFLRTTRPG